MSTVTQSARSVNLPQEIWILIAQLLPDYTLWTLRFLNSAFFQEAMNTRYRSLVLFDRCWADFRAMDETIRRWKRFADPNTGHRVRSIIVQPTYLDSYFARDEYYLRNRATLKSTVTAPRRSWCASFLGHLRRFARSSSGSVDVQSADSLDPLEHLSAALVDVLPCFSYVTEYDARWGFASCNFKSVLVMSLIWTSLGSNLSSLKWESSLEILHRLLLETPSIHFPVLTNLSLRLCHHSSQSHTDSELFQLSLAPFLDRHCSTVHTLAITRANTLPPIDYTALLLTVGQFPRLQDLSLAFGVVTGRYIQMSSPSALARLLADHASTLQRLSINLSNVIANDFLEEFEDTFRTVFPVSLSNLVRLRIYYCSPHSTMPKVKKAVMDIAHRYSDTLTELVLYAPCNLTFEEVESWVASLSDRQAARLKTLLLVIDDLSLRLLDLLTTTLPGLTRLTLRFRQIPEHEADLLRDGTKSNPQFYWLTGRMPSPGVTGTFFMHR